MLTIKQLSFKITENLKEISSFINEDNEKIVSCIINDILKDNNNKLYNTLKDNTVTNENVKDFKDKLSVAFTSANIFKTIAQANSFRKHLTNNKINEWVTLIGNVHYSFHATRINGVRYLSIVNTDSLNKLDMITIIGTTYCNKFAAKCHSLIDHNQTADNNKKFPITFDYYISNVSTKFKKQRRQKTIMLNKSEAAAANVVLCSLDLSNVGNDVDIYRRILTDDDLDKLQKKHSVLNKVDKKSQKRKDDQLSYNPKQLSKTKALTKPDNINDYDSDTDNDGFGLM